MNVQVAETDAPPREVGDVYVNPSWRIGTLTYDRKGLARLFAWLLGGDFSWQLRERAVGTVATLILKAFGASDSLLGLLIGSIPAALGMLVVPITNTMSDNHRGKMGRRIPFLLVPIPFAVVALIALGFTPAIAEALRSVVGSHTIDVRQSRIVVFVIGWTIFEVAAVITNGIYTALVNDVVPHELLGRFLGAFRMVSMGAGIIFNSMLLPLADLHYREIFIGLSIIYGVGMYLVCLNVKEGEYPPPAPITANTKSKALAATVEYFRETCSIPFYLLFYAALVALSLMQLAGGPYGIFFAKSVGVNLGLYGKLQAVMFTISFCTAYLFGLLNDRFHPLRVMIVSSVVFTLGSFIAGAFVHSPTHYAAIMLPTWFAGGGTWASLPTTQQLILPRSRFGAFSSAVGVMTSLSGMICVPAVGALLDASHHDYRLINYVTAAFGMLAVSLLLLFHARFMAMGGPKGYVPPE